MSPTLRTLSEFIIVIRATDGSLHAIYDKRKGPGGLATWETREQAEVGRRMIPDLRKFESYVLEVAR